MILSKSQNSDELAINLLSEGSMQIHDLVNKISEEQQISIQAVYKAIKKLLREEVVVRHKKTIALNIPWVHRLTRFTDKAISSYSLKSYNSFLDYQEKQRSVLSFDDFTEMDAYWIHMMISLAQQYEEPIFLYNSHDWYLLARPDLKSEFFIWIEKFKRPSFMLIGHTTPLDVATIKENKSEYLQLAAEDDRAFPDWSSMTVIGDFVIETRSEMESAESIHRLYEKYAVYNDDMCSELSAIIDKKQKWKIVITRNKEKAKKIKKRISKYFYLSKSIRENLK